MKKDKVFHLTRRQVLARVLFGTIGLPLLFLLVLGGYRVTKLDEVKLIAAYEQAVESWLGIELEYSPNISFDLDPLPWLVFRDVTLNYSSEDNKDLRIKIDRLAVSLDVPAFLFKGKIIASAISGVGVSGALPAAAIFNIMPGLSQQENQKQSQAGNQKGNQGKDTGKNKGKNKGKDKAGSEADSQQQAQDEAKAGLEDVNGVAVVNNISSVSVDQMQIKVLEQDTIVGNLLVNRSVMLRGNDGNWKLDMDSGWNGYAFKVAGQIGDASSYFDDVPWPVALDLQGDGVDINVNGQIDVPHQLRGINLRAALDVQDIDAGIRLLQGFSLGSSSIRAAFRDYSADADSFTADFDIRGDWLDLTAHRLSARLDLDSGTFLQAEGKISRLDALSGVELGVRMETDSLLDFIDRLGVLPGKFDSDINAGLEGDDQDVALGFSLLDQVPATLTGRVVGDLVRGFELDIQDATIAQSSLFGKWRLNGRVDKSPYQHIVDLQVSSINLPKIRSRYKQNRNVSFENAMRAGLGVAYRLLGDSRLAFRAQVGSLVIGDDVIDDFSQMGIFANGEVQRYFSSGSYLGGSYSVSWRDDKDELILDASGIDTAGLFNLFGLDGFIEGRSSILIRSPLDGDGDGKKLGKTELAWLMGDGQMRLPKGIVGNISFADDDIDITAQSKPLFCGIFYGLLDDDMVWRLQRAVIDSDWMLVAFDGEVDFSALEYDVTMYPMGRSSALAVLLPARLRYVLQQFVRDTVGTLHVDVEKKVTDMVGGFSPFLLQQRSLLDKSQASIESCGLPLASDPAGKDKIRMIDLHDEILNASSELSQEVQAAATVSSLSEQEEKVLVQEILKNLINTN